MELYYRAVQFYLDEQPGPRCDSLLKLDRALRQRLALRNPAGNSLPTFLESFQADVVPWQLHCALSGKHLKLRAASEGILPSFFAP